MLVIKMHKRNASSTSLCDLLWEHVHDEYAKWMLIFHVNNANLRHIKVLNGSKEMHCFLRAEEMNPIFRRNRS